MPNQILEAILDTIEWQCFVIFFPSSFSSSNLVHSMENLIQENADEEKRYSQEANGLNGQACESLKIC